MPHTIRAEAAGFAPASSSIILDKDVDVSLILERIVEAPPASTPSPTVPGPSKMPSLPSSAVSVDRRCLPPYYYEQGIKKYKPECL
jgi:hypothetical protein